MKLCGFDVGLDKPLFLIAGTCVVESRQMTMDTAGALKEMCAAVGIPFIYKSSYDKANRSSIKSWPRRTPTPRGSMRRVRGSRTPSSARPSAVAWACGG